MKLWQSKSCDDWRAALDRYDDVIHAQSVNRLEELDAWHHNELPKLIAAHKPAYITLEELERATVWKMKRGVWRERNRLLVLSNAPELVKQSSQDAFAAVPDPRKPVTILCELSGVGPATASAVLASYAPDFFPFFDELVAQQIPGLGKVAFTASYYQRYAEAIRARMEQLNRDCEKQKWSAHGVSQALWANSGGKAATSPPDLRKKSSTKDTKVH